MMWHLRTNSHAPRTKQDTSQRPLTRGDFYGHHLDIAVVSSPVEFISLNLHSCAVARLEYSSRCYCVAAAAAASAILRSYCFVISKPPCTTSFSIIWQFIYQLSGAFPFDVVCMCVYYCCDYYCVVRGVDRWYHHWFSSTALYSYTLVHFFLLLYTTTLCCSLCLQYARSHASHARTHELTHTEQCT